MGFEAINYPFLTENDKIPNVPMTYWTNRLQETTTFPSLPPNDFLGLYFNLSSQLVKIRISNKEEFNIGRQQYNLFFFPKRSCQIQFQSGRHSAFCLHLTLDYLRYMAVASETVLKFENYVLKRRPAALFESPQTLNYEIKSSIRAILADRFDDKFRNQMREIKYATIILVALRDKPIRHTKKYRPIDEPILKLIESYIAANANHPMTINFISDKFNISTRRLCEGWKAAYGKTIHQFMIQIRMKKAEEVLKNTDLPLLEVSDMFGFKSPSYFSAAFSRVFGHSPRTIKRLKDQNTAVEQNKNN